MDGYQMSREMSIEANHCGIHPPFLVTIVVECENDWQYEMIEGAFEGYVRFTDCTICAAESIGLMVDDYVGIFVEKFLPLLPIAEKFLRSIKVKELPKRLSYG
jgi:hypothetical protein